MLLVFFDFNNYYLVLFDQKVTDFFRACIMYQHYCCREHCRLTALMPESCSEKKVTMMVISCQQMLLSRNSSITERLWMFWRATFSSSISSTSTLWSLLPQSLVKAKWPWCDQKKKWLGGWTRRQNRCARQNPWSHKRAVAPFSQASWSPWLSSRNLGDSGKKGRLTSWNSAVKPLKPSSQGHLSSVPSNSLRGEWLWNSIWMPTCDCAINVSKWSLSRNYPPPYTCRRAMLWSGESNRSQC